MIASRHPAPLLTLQAALFVMLQVAVMLLAISNESLWIDEFWTAYFAELPSFRAFLDMLMVPYGSQTPLHFLHFYLWEQLVPRGEFLLRVANLPMFVVGQLALFWALRSYPAKFSFWVLTAGALHPMIWQYANEARPYIMMYAGAQMMLAHLLHLHSPAASEGRVDPLFMAFFLLGGVLLAGASMLGVFWVFAACLYLAVHHWRHASWRLLLRGPSLPLLGLFIAAMAVLAAYYLSSLLQGQGASRLATSTPSTVVFAGYELLGLLGVGPSRLDLRAALNPYAAWLVAATVVTLITLAVGLRAAKERIAPGRLLTVAAFSLLPVVIVIASGFAMHWRVLGRHLIAALPLLNLLLAMGLLTLFDAGRRRGRTLRWAIAAACLLSLTVSSLSLRFAERHKKDDYRAAASLAKQGLAQGQRVWWAAGSVGAHYYAVPGEFDYLAELTSNKAPLACADSPGVQSVANASQECLRALSAPDVVISSKPETFDTRGDIARYLKDGDFTAVREMPAFTVWQRVAPVSSGTK
jgi:hypothetical protein